MRRRKIEDTRVSPVVGRRLMSAELEAFVQTDLQDVERAVYRLSVQNSRRLTDQEIAERVSTTFDVPFTTQQLDATRFVIKAKARKAGLL